MLPHYDDLMVISIMVNKYKIQRVFIDQGSSTNSTFRKMELLESRLEEWPDTLTGFSSEQVEIRGCIEIKTTFGTRRDAW
ncbi:hypothetical protein CR513_11619, partial [Mucuna pruriens]